MNPVGLSTIAEGRFYSHPNAPFTVQTRMEDIITNRNSSAPFARWPETGEPLRTHDARWNRRNPRRLLSHRIALWVVASYGTATPRHRGRKLVPPGSWSHVSRVRN